MTTWPRLNMAVGPAEVSPRTLRDMARPVIYHNDPAFKEIFEHTSEMLKQVYRTRYDVVIFQGEAIAGLEAAAASLISPGDKVLNLVSGVFGKWFEDFIEKQGGETIELAVPYDEAIDPEDVRKTLIRNPGVKFLSVVHSETPSGTVNPVREIGQIAREFGVLTLVDTVSGLGSEHLCLEDWGIDVAISAPQKCLGGTPGLSLIAVSPAAWQVMEQRPRPLRGSFLSLLDWKTTWIEKQRFPFTPSISDVYALESVLTQTLEVGIERYVECHQEIAKACRAGVRALNLELWPAREEISAGCVTTVKTPAGITAPELIATMRGRYGVTISPGLGELAEITFRLGHMGLVQAHPTALVAQLAILELALADCGHPVEFGTGVGAAMTALPAWDDWG
jgi:pyridoxamine--pyruvate transaminase